MGAGMDPAKEVKWIGPSPKKDAFGDKIKDEFIDGRTCGRLGGWAIFTPENWKAFGIGKFGAGYGQRYRLIDGEFVKVEG